MIKENPHNGNETKSYISPRDIFKSGAIYFLSKNMKIFQWILNSQVLSFMAKVNSSNGNETKSDIFHGAHSNLMSFFIGRKILKFFNEFFNWYLSVSLQKWTQTSKEQ